MNTETLEFQAEARQLLQDVFLSELIPNASDALGERRLAGLKDDSLGAVKDVRLTPRLTSSPACLVSDAGEPTVTSELFTDRLTDGVFDSVEAPSGHTPAVPRYGMFIFV